MSLLEQNIMKSKQVNQSFLSESKRKFKARDNKKYEIETIVNSVVYSYKVENQLPNLYYLVLCKGNQEEKIPETFSSSNTPPKID